MLDDIVYSTVSCWHGCKAKNILQTLSVFVVWILPSNWGIFCRLFISHIWTMWLITKIEQRSLIEHRVVAIHFFNSNIYKGMICIPLVIATMVKVSSLANNHEFLVKIISIESGFPAYRSVLKCNLIIASSPIIGKDTILDKEDTMELKKVMQ